MSRTKSQIKSIPNFYGDSSFESFPLVCTEHGLVFHLTHLLYIFLIMTGLWVK